MKIEEKIAGIVCNPHCVCLLECSNLSREASIDFCPYAPKLHKALQLFKKEKQEIFKALENQGLVPNKRIYHTDGYYTPDELQYNKRFEKYQSFKSRLLKEKQRKEN